MRQVLFAHITLYKSNETRQSDTTQFNKWHPTLLRVSTPKQRDGINPYPANVENRVSS
jgi:hypothetical protein